MEGSVHCPVYFSLRRNGLFVPGKRFTGQELKTQLQMHWVIAYESELG
jgi:hypothetical protein